MSEQPKSQTKILHRNEDVPGDVECGSQESNGIAGAKLEEQPKTANSDEGQQPEGESGAKSEGGDVAKPEGGNVAKSEGGNVADDIRKRPESRPENPDQQSEASSIVGKLSSKEYPYASSEALKQIEDSKALGADDKKLLRVLLYELDSQYLTDKIKTANYPDDEGAILDQIKNSSLPDGLTNLKPEPEQLKRVFKSDACLEGIKEFLQRVKEKESISVSGKDALRKLVLKMAHPEEYKRQVIKDAIKSAVKGFVGLWIGFWVLELLIRWVIKACIFAWHSMFVDEVTLAFMKGFGTFDYMAKNAMEYITDITDPIFCLICIIGAIVIILDAKEALSDSKKPSES